MCMPPQSAPRDGGAAGRRLAFGRHFAAKVQTPWAQCTASTSSMWACRWRAPAAPRDCTSAACIRAGTPSHLPILHYAHSRQSSHSHSPLQVRRARCAKRFPVVRRDALWLRCGAHVRGDALHPPPGHVAHWQETDEWPGKSHTDAPILPICPNFPICHNSFLLRHISPRFVF